MDLIFIFPKGNLDEHMFTFFNLLPIIHFSARFLRCVNLFLFISVSPIG